MTRNITFGLLLAAMGTATAAPIYVWTDAQGIRHYSDRAASGAARLDELARRIPGATPAKTPPPAPQAFHAPHIVSPVSGSTLAAGRTEVMISVAVPGGLGADERLVYRLDGHVLDEIPPRATRLAVDQLGSGRHKLDVELVVRDTLTGRCDRVVFDVAPPDAPSGLQAGSRPPS